MRRILGIVVIGVATIMATVVKAEVPWIRVYDGILGSDTLPGFYSGGFERNKQALADIDTDGDLDFFIGMWDGTIMFYENIGNAGEPKFKFITENFGNINVRGTMSKGYAAPEFVDIDNDGDLDCFSGDYDGKVHFYENKGTAQAYSFVLVTSNMFPVLWRHSNPAFCDIDADGDYDMFIGEEEDQNAFYLNTGTPDSFCFDTLITARFCNDSNYQQIDPTFCDIDTDGDYDLFYGEIKGRMVYWRNYGTPTNDSFVYITDSLGPFAYNRSGGFFADIDGNNTLDLFFGGKDGVNRFYKNIGTPDSFVYTLVTEQYLYIDFDMYSSPTFCDIDGDKDQDMFVGADNIVGSANPGVIRFLRNVGDTLQSKWLYETKAFENISTPSCPAPTFVDIDENKFMDLFIGNSSGKIIYWHNTGTSWELITVNFANIDVGDYSKPVFGDIDNDKDYDLLIGNSTGKLLLFINKGDPITPIFDSLPDTCIDSVNTNIAPAIGDCDLDGDLDIIVGLGSGYLRFYKNESTISNPVWSIADTTEYKAMNVGRLSTPTLTDIDFDGDLDLFVGEGDGGINCWKNGLIGVEENTFTSVSGYRLAVSGTKDKTIRYYLPIASDISLRVYDLVGREVENLVNGIRDAGYHTVNWNTLKKPSGVYFIVLENGGYKESKKIVIVK
ncbi:MAG: T9SS type A sorting domain-containing protein [Candidatus Stahlbacteria bacterium]|nr:T9SS type A sorting domain-containing protein [Candidatus Stahlbacteria bacterium]